MYRYLALLPVFMLSACATTAPESAQESTSSLVGTWELVDVSAFSTFDSRPTGIAARKYHFTSDGTLYVIDADAQLTEDVLPIPYTYNNRILKMSVPSYGEAEIQVEFPSPSRMVLIYSETERWTHERMTGERPFDRPIEPRSVEVLQTTDPAEQMSNLDIVYDTEDYAHLPASERIVGVWEATAYSGVPPADWPPYGFPNYKWIFTGDGKFFVLDPSETDGNTVVQVDYEVSGATLSVKPVDVPAESVEIGFNRWGHLEILDKGVTIGFKLLSKDPATIQKLPAKITLLDSGRHF